MSLGGPTCWIQKGRYSINRRKRRCQASSACGWNPSQLFARALPLLVWSSSSCHSKSILHQELGHALWPLLPQLRHLQGWEGRQTWPKPRQHQGLHKSLQELHHPWHLRFAGGANRYTWKWQIASKRDKIARWHQVAHHQITNKALTHQCAQNRSPTWLFGWWHLSIICAHWRLFLCQHVQLAKHHCLTRSSQSTSKKN